MRGPNTCSRGDPVSQAALLSTRSKLMLASRLLDRREHSADKRPFAGWRSFAFTDQLDATNRLFYDLRDGGPDPQGYLPLNAERRQAFLRRSGTDQRRYEGGGFGACSKPTAMR